MAESPLSLEAPPGSFRWPISSVCWVLLIAGLLFFPVAYKEYRYAFSACVFLTLLIAWHDQGVYLHPALLASLVGVMLLGLFLIIYDRVWLQNSSGFMEISFWIGNPLIYTLFILAFSRNDDLPLILERAMILASWLISGNALTYLSFSILDVPYPLEFLDLEYGFGQDVRGFVAYTTNNLPVLTFTATFFLIQVFLLGKRSLVHLATLAITLPAIALSLRLAFILNICLSAVIIVVMA